MTKLEQKDHIVTDYLEGRLSHKLASALLRELGYEDWEVNLYLDNDDTGPE